MSNTQEQAPSSGIDTIKWVLSLAVLAGAIYANHILVDDSLPLRAGVVIALVFAGLAIGFSTTKGKNGIEFAKEARIEGRKVVWPTRQETIQTTLIIMVAVTIVSLFLWGIDAVIFNIIDLII